MDKRTFSKVWWECGANAARIMAEFFGIARAQVDLWELSVERPAHWPK